MTIDTCAEYWTRLNYETVATKSRSVCLVENYVTHTVRNQLPTPIELNLMTEKCRRHVMHYV